MEEVMLKLNNISFSIGKKNILQDISVSFEPGKIHMILGPNGSGKSSLLKIFAGETKYFTGEVLYENKQIQNIHTLELARKRAVLSQQPHLDFPLSVFEVVMMGRYPHFDFQPSVEDKKICNEVMSMLGIKEMSERNYLTLSGGEKQRVQYARVLAQIWNNTTEEIRYLFLDEPLNSLDIKYQQEFLQIAKSFMNDKTVVAIVIHDINLAIKFGDTLHFMKNGRMVCSGKTNDVLSKELIHQVFDINSEIIHTPSGNPLVIYE